MSDNTKPVDIELLRELEPISTLSTDQLSELAAEAQMLCVQKNVQLLSENNIDCATYLLTGDIEITMGKGDKKMLKGGTDDARHPITANQTDQGSAITLNQCMVIRVNKELVDTMLTWGQISAPETEIVMSGDGIMTIDRASWLKSMIRSPTFRKLPPANIESLLNKLEPIRVNAGDVIIKQGDVGDYFYMINEGTSLVTRNPDDDEDSVEIAELNEGASFGEAALISNNPRNATVSMMSDGVLLRLSKDNFNTLLKQPTLNWLDFSKAESKVNKGAQWIDVRLSSEFNHGHLPGAINIPMQQLHRKVRDLDKSIFYICYCQTGSRSSAATFVFTQTGLQAGALEGGLNNVPGGKLTHEETLSAAQ